MLRKMRMNALQTIAGAAVLLAAASAFAGAPESYRKAWNDPAVVKQIDEGIERNRKGDAAIELVDADGRPIPSASLEIQQKTHQFLFGCNAFVLGQRKTPERNRKYEEAFTHLFNFATVPFYWTGTEPKQGELRYQEGCVDIWRRPPPDRFVAFAKKHGITLKGHPLLWHAYNPTWLSKDPAEFKKLCQKRFREIAERYAKDIKIWDVVNESQVCEKDFPLYTPGKEYVAWAFNEVSPLFRSDNLLLINELTPASHGGVGEENAYYRQIKQLLGQGVNVEGIGFQFHLLEKGYMEATLAGKQFPPAKLLDIYQSFAAFDRPFFITEITIPSKGKDGEAVQAEMIANLYRLWFSVPRMEGITYWNFADGTAAGEENKALGGLIDKEMNPKASYKSLDRLINHNWKSRLATKTDVAGKANFRGFYGKYIIKATAKDKVKEFEIELDKKIAKPCTN
jgi:endo-1,4-beta-xylanase